MEDREVVRTLKMEDPAATPRLVPVLHAMAAVGLALWFAVVVLWPWLDGILPASQVQFAEGLCRRFFCHRLPPRSLGWHGGQMLVCARCTGVVAGYLLGAVLAVCGAERLCLWRIPWAVLIIAIMPASWLAGWLDWLDPLQANSPALWHAERVIAGACGGLGGYILISRCVVLIWQWWERRQLQSPAIAAERSP